MCSPKHLPRTLEECVLLKARVRKNTLRLKAKGMEKRKKAMLHAEFRGVSWVRAVFSCVGGLRDETVESHSKDFVLQTEQQ